MENVIKCPHCKEKIIEHKPLNAVESLPEDGDLFICGMCYKLGMYDNKKIVKPSVDYLMSIPSDLQAVLDTYITRIKESKTDD